MSLGAGRLLATNELGEVVAIEAESGDILWTQEIFRGHGMSRPLVMKDRVVVGDSSGNIYSLDINDGTLLETAKREWRGGCTGSRGKTSSRSFRPRGGLVCCRWLKNRNKKGQ